MEKDQIIIFKNRGLISIRGDDAKNYLQNIITNDINKVSHSNSIFSAKNFLTEPALIIIPDY